MAVGARGSVAGRDQPRACGAGGLPTKTIWRLVGSTPRVRSGRRVRAMDIGSRGASPRVRSGPRPADPTQHQHRINPARAEQVPSNSMAEFLYRDQPRACGAGSCIVLRSCPGQRHAIFDSFIAESVASAHRYQCGQGRPANAAILQPTRILAGV